MVIFTNILRPARYRNVRVRYSGFIKTKRARLGAGLLIDVFDADSEDLLFQRVEPRVVGTKDWTKCEVEFVIPLEAYTISIGAFIDGPGEMYFAGLKFEELGPA